MPAGEGCNCSRYSISPQVEQIVQKHGKKPDSLIPVLHETQKALGHLTTDAMKQIADLLGIPFSKVYGVATFYSLFSTHPKGQNVIRLCESAPCHINGAPQVLDAIKDELGVDVGQTTTDGKFTLEFTSCLGVCGVAPAIMINDTVFGNLTPEKVREVLRKY